MTITEYKLKQQILTDQYEFDQRKLAREYALSNNTVQVGDVITDHNSSIVVDKIKYHMSLSEPCCVYIGPLLTKSGVPRKDGTTHAIYQSNLKQ